VRPGEDSFLLGFIFISFISWGGQRDRGSEKERK
jgi:hypothetical protein